MWNDISMHARSLVDKHCWSLPFGKSSMTYAPTTNAPARNANVEAYINPDPNPNPNPNPNPYPALNQKPNHTHESNSVFGEVSMPEQLSPEHMSCHLGKSSAACIFCMHCIACTTVLHSTCNGHVISIWINSFKSSNVIKSQIYCKYCQWTCSQRSDSDSFLIWKPDFTHCERKALSKQTFETHKKGAFLDRDPPRKPDSEDLWM